MNKEELLAKVDSLGDITKEQRNSIVCSLIGHSKIISTCFGYIYCGRCKQQIGDSLGGVFDGSDKVIVGHKCDTCVSNYEKLTWEDKIFCPDPFEENK